MATRHWPRPQQGVTPGAPGTRRPCVGACPRAGPDRYLAAFAFPVPALLRGPDFLSRKAGRLGPREPATPVPAAFPGPAPGWLPREPAPRARRACQGGPGGVRAGSLGGREATTRLYRVTSPRHFVIQPYEIKHPMSLCVFFPPVLVTNVGAEIGHRPARTSLHACAHGVLPWVPHDMGYNHLM